MKFRTEIEIPRSEVQLDYSSCILSLGSCFASSMGGKLCDSKFEVAVNPTGVLFNPLSIVSTLQRFGNHKRVEVSELQSGKEGWFHYDFHGSLSDATTEKALAKINAAVDIGARALAKCDTIIITLGSAWIYELASNGGVVANCHKQPSKSFSRRAMSVEEVVESLSAQVEQHPDKRFIFSVSPVRHIADGLAENSLSKATLRVAISRVVERYASASYFPAYEILVDDLRDYRFYGNDMVHPSQQAVEYIWSKFVGSQISAEARATMASVEKIVKAASHRPFNVDSSAFQEFCLGQLEMIKKHPNVDFAKESDYFRSHLQNIL